MIFYIDTLNNLIKYYRLDNKKEIVDSFSLSFNYSLNPYDNKLKAITEFLAKEEVKKLTFDKSNSLIVSDDVMGYGLFDLPANLSKRKLNDVFTTRFRMCYPNFKQYYFDSFELDRNDSNVIYFYKFAKRDSVNQLASLFKNNSISITCINTFSSLFTVKDKGLGTYPIATLIVGEYDSELIICKGDNILSVNYFGFGTNVLFNEENYLDSAYEFNNDEAKRFSVFIKDHFITNEAVTDDNILKADIDESMAISKPKEIRLLKDDALKQYNIKNNFRKFYARIVEIIEYYVKAPWYFPMNEINVLADVKVITNLMDACKEDPKIRFIDLAKSLDTLVAQDISHNPLFNQTFKKERKKIDWRAFLTMEIGGKKKKA